MKVRFVTLFLTLALISISTEFFSTTLILEKSASAIEISLLDKKVSDKQDDLCYLTNIQNNLYISTNTIYSDSNNLYSFIQKSPPFRPPIFS